MVAICRTRSRSPGTRSATASGGRPGITTPAKTVPGGCPSCSAGPATPVVASATSDLRRLTAPRPWQRPPRPRRPGPRARRAAGASARWRTRRGPRRTSRSHPAPRRSGRRRATGQRLGDAERPGALDQQAAHGCLHRVVVPAEHRVAEERANLRLLGIEGLGSLARWWVTSPSGGSSALQIPLARKAIVGTPACPVPNASMRGARSSASPDSLMAPGPQRPAGDDCRPRRHAARRSGSTARANMSCSS